MVYHQMIPPDHQMFDTVLVQADGNLSGPAHLRASSLASFHHLVTNKHRPKLQQLWDMTTRLLSPQTSRQGASELLDELRALAAQD